MCKALFLALGLSLSTAALAGAVAPPPRAEAHQAFRGVLVRLPDGKLALEARTRTHALDFASRTASREAERYVGMLITVRADVRPAGLLVYSSSPLAAKCRAVAQ